MGKSTPSAPAPRNLGVELAQIMQAGPELLKNQQSLSPGYTNLNLQNLGSTLNGTPTQAGYLQQYSQNVLPQVTAANDAATTTARGATVNDLATLGPKAVSAIRGMDPGSASIYDILQKQAGEGLAAGNQMTPAQLAQLNNSLRSSQGARGISYGPAASYQEVLANSMYGDQLQQQRQATAGNVLNLGNSLYTLPGMNLAMGGSAPTGQATALLGGGNANSNAGNTFATLGGYGSDLFNTNYNAQASANINSANATNSMYGNLAGLGGAALMGLAL